MRVGGGLTVTRTETPDMSSATERVEKRRSSNMAPPNRLDAVSMSTYAAISSAKTRPCGSHQPIQLVAAAGARLCAGRRNWPPAPSTAATAIIPKPLASESVWDSDAAARTWKAGSASSCSSNVEYTHSTDEPVDLMTTLGTRNAIVARQQRCECERHRPQQVRLPELVTTYRSDGLCCRTEKERGALMPPSL